MRARDVSRRLRAPGGDREDEEPLTLEILRAELKHFAREDLSALGDRLERLVSLGRASASADRGHDRRSHPSQSSRLRCSSEEDGPADNSVGLELPGESPGLQLARHSAVPSRATVRQSVQQPGAHRARPRASLRAVLAVDRSAGADFAGCPPSATLPETQDRRSGATMRSSRADALAASWELRQSVAETGEDEGGGAAFNWVRFRKGYRQGNKQPRHNNRDSSGGCRVGRPSLASVRLNGARATSTAQNGPIRAAALNGHSRSWEASGELSSALRPTVLPVVPMEGIPPRRASEKSVDSDCSYETPVPDALEDIDTLVPMLDQVDNIHQEESDDVLKQRSRSRSDAILKQRSRTSLVSVSGEVAKDADGGRWTSLRRTLMQADDRRAQSKSTSKSEDLPDDSSQAPCSLATGSPTLAAVVLSDTFEAVSAICVLVNAVVIGVQTELLARQEPNWACAAVNRGFCYMFVLELALRICAEGLFFFTEQGERGWANCLDALVVFMQLGAEICGLIGGFVPPGASSFGVLRLYKVTRLIRVSRDARVLNLLQELRTMMVSVTDSFLSLVWTIALLSLITFMFAIFLTQLVADFRLARGHEAVDKDLVLHFGSLHRAMLSLYQASSGGINWHEVLDPLYYNFSPVVVVVFVMYMFFVLFALTNVVTGVFVESALRIAEEDKRQQLMHQMSSLFNEADEDNSGTVTWDEFQEHLAAPQLQSFLKAIDLDPEEARALFHLLDVDESGEIDSQELVMGCLRLHGQAKAIELAAFMHEYRRAERRQRYHEEIVEQSLAFLCENLDALKSSASEKRASNGLNGAASDLLNRSAEECAD